MLLDTLIRVPRTSGLHPIQPRGSHGSREIASWRLRLGPGESATHQRADEETIVVLQEGAGTFGVDDDTSSSRQSWSVSRRGVFTERATAVYVPPGAVFHATATTMLEAILMSAPCRTRTAAAIVTPADVEVLARGRDGYAREVHNLFVTDAHAQRLMVGETFNPGGHWSSYPPHKHDGRDGEPELEEVYHFRIDPPQGFGQQTLYAAGEAPVVHQVIDGDVVVLPYGYHPVCSPPGYRLYYLWVMAGDERRLALYEDPAHRWIHELGR
jgi:5-deoxy-glucuronate isomerase